MSGTVVKLIATWAKFVKHFFGKIETHNTVICDVPVLGHFILEKKDDKLCYDFLPSLFLATESGINCSRKNLHLASFSAPILKKDMSIEKMSNLS